MRRLRSLQGRIAFVYGVLLVTAIALVSSLLAALASDTYRSSLDERLEQEAQLLGESIEAYFEGRMSLDDVQEHIERDARLIGADITVVSTEGRLLASSTDESIRGENLLARPEMAEALANGSSRRSALDGPNGVEMYYTSAAIEVRGTRVGVARLAVPAAEVEIHVQEILTSVVLTDVLISVFAAGAVFVLARRMSRSVQIVARGARQLAAGNLDHRIAVQGFDESRELADAFNQMAANLRGMLERLSTERGHLARILETMQDGVIVLASDGMVRSYNPTAARFLGWPEDAPREELPRPFIKDPGLQGMVSEAMNAGNPIHREVLLFDRQPLSVIATPVPQDGAPDILVTMHDLTAIRRLERSQKEFVGNVSHELRSPLAAITALSEALETGALEDETVARDFVVRIHRETDRMTLLVDDLLELSRLEAERTLAMESVELRPLLNEIQEGFAPKAGDKHLNVEWLVPADLPSVWADRERLRRVFTNILTNALKFTPEQGRVVVSARQTPGAVEFTVRDTGCGISESDLPRIFERFYQADPSRMDGTGLGLAIVEQILQAHGGSINVETSAGQGTAFAFTIPLAP